MSQISENTGRFDGDLADLDSQQPERIHLARFEPVNQQPLNLAPMPEHPLIAIVLIAACGAWQQLLNPHKKLVTTHGLRTC